MKQNCIGVILVSVALLFPKPAFAQSLTDSIWKGTASVSIPALIPFRDGVAQNDPRVTSGLTLTLPVEAWFLTTTEFVIVLDQRALGADPTRAKLQPLIGSWRGITYGRSQRTQHTGTYDRVRRSFTAVREKLVNSSWSYKGKTSVQGTYRLTSATRMAVSGSYTATPNPSGPNNPQYSGGVPTFTAVLTKTSLHPSTQITDAFSDTRGR